MLRWDCVPRSRFTFPLRSGYVPCISPENGRNYVPFTGFYVPITFLRFGAFPNALALLRSSHPVWRYIILLA